MMIVTLAQRRIRFELDSNRRRLMYVFRLLPADRFDEPIEPAGPTVRDLVIDLILLEASLTRRILETGVDVPPGTLTKDPAEMENAAKWRAATVRRLRVALTGNRKRTLRVLECLTDEDLDRPVEAPTQTPLTVETALLRFTLEEHAVVDRIAAALGLRIV